MWHAYWSSSSFLQNIIKICHRVSWSAQDSGFRGDNYIMKKKVRVVSLAYGMPTGPPLNLYQILSYSQTVSVMACTRFRLQGRQLHKEVSNSCLLHTTRLLVLLFIPTKYYQIISNSMGVMSCTISASGEISSRDVQKYWYTGIPRYFFGLVRTAVHLPVPWYSDDSIFSNILL